MKLNYQEHAFRRQEDTPAPCTYNPTNSFTEKVVSSHMAGTAGQKWAKGRRFVTPTCRRDQPGPNAYRPRNNFNENFLFQNSAKVVIGK